jgi:hypothetical protein
VIKILSVLSPSFAAATHFQTTHGCREHTQLIELSTPQSFENCTSKEMIWRHAIQIQYKSTSCVDSWGYLGILIRLRKSNACLDFQRHISCVHVIGQLGPQDASATQRRNNNIQIAITCGAILFQKPCSPTSCQSPSARKWASSPNQRSYRFRI